MFMLGIRETLGPVSIDLERRFPYNFPLTGAQKKTTMMRIGVDTGGTFTDFVFSEGDRITTLKVPSTPADPSRAISGGLTEVLERPFRMVHGTTVATNAFLQRRMARCAIVCTRGFEHLLHIGRQNRIGLFDLEVRKPDAIVPLALCHGVDERTFHTGEVSVPIDTEGLGSLCGRLRKQNVESVAVVFLHAYANPRNERSAAKVFREAGFQVTASHEILPEYREYERAVVTTLNAALQPVIARYIDRLSRRLGQGRLLIMQSNGGVLSPKQVMREPVRTLMSGPAGGVIAARRFSRLCKEKNLITLDMGGTSTDVSIIRDGRLLLTREGVLEHLPLRLPVIDIATVGAGGGSIARIDRGGVLQVGPRSAGADPGPACYGRSAMATVTDAFVVNGVIDPGQLLAGTLKIFPGRSTRAVQALADRLGRPLHETAEGIILISVSAMERAIRSVTLERGEDPRFYTLFPFGGAGGLVATLLADRLGVRRIVVPPFQGVFSALGMLMADFQRDLSCSVLKANSPGLARELDGIFAGLSTRATTLLSREGYGPDRSHLKMEVDIRYRGQSYELTVPYTRNVLADFHRSHRQLYSYQLADEECEVVNARVSAIGLTPDIRLPRPRKKPGVPPVHARRPVYFNGRRRSFDLYMRRTLAPGHEIQGPAVVIAEDATVVVDDHYRAVVDPHAALVLTRKE